MNVKVTKLLDALHIHKIYILSKFQSSSINIHGDIKLLRSQGHLELMKVKFTKLLYALYIHKIYKQYNFRDLASIFMEIRRYQDLSTSISISI